MSEPVTAVLDRIVDGEHATLLLEDDGRVVDELTVAVDALPEAGRHEGAVFTLLLEDGTLREVSYRPEETRARRESARERFDRLAERLDDRD